MMPFGHVYTLRHEATVATAITVLQLKAGAASPLLILSASAGQRGTIASLQESIALVRKTAAATVTTAAVGTHLFKHRVGDPTPDLTLSTTGTGVIGTAEGTDGDILKKLPFNVLNGLYHLPIPEGRLHVPGGGLLAMKFLNAPTTQTWLFEIELMELG